MLEIKIAGLEQAIAALEEIQGQAWVADVLQQQIPGLGRIHKRQMDLVAGLPYSESHRGQKKPSKLRVADGMGDLGYARDTLSLMSDLLFRWEVDGDALINYSDLEYAGAQFALAKGKGVEMFASDDVYAKILEAAVGDKVEAIWGQG
jgi:hypothetical protein